jgi:SAM-dependent methyltransferase
VLHHLPNIEFALNELYNVLGKGGFFLIYEPNAESCISFLGRIIRKLKRAKDVSVERDQESIVPHEKPLVSNEICRKLANANIISKTTVGIAGTLLCRTAFLNNKKTICQIIVLLDEALSHIPVAEYLGGMIKIMGEKNA